jgi:uncharacterized protein (UPF0332 family)
LPDENRVALAKYRLDRACDELKHAEDGLKNDLLPQSISDSYYAIFHSMRAVLALDGKDFKKHSGVIANFQKDYIKEGVFDKDMSRDIQSAFDWSSDADYQDFFVISKEDAQEQLNHARIIYERLKAHIGDRISQKECQGDV